MLLFVFVLFKVSRTPIPKGITGRQATELAKKISNTILLNEFEKISSLSFTFQNVQHFHDYKNLLIKVSWKEKKEEIFVVYSLVSNISQEDEESNSLTREHEVYINKVRIRGQRATEILRQAQDLHSYALFWFHPFPFLYKDNVMKSYIQERALIFQLGKGKNMSHYLVITDETYLPIALRVWSERNSFVQGVEFSFENWLENFCGSKISLKRKNKMHDFNFEDVHCNKG